MTPNLLPLNADRTAAFVMIRLSRSRTCQRYFSLPADPAFVGGKNLMICSFLGDELTLDGVGLADGADIFVWNGKEVKDPNTLSPCQF